ALHGGTGRDLPAVTDDSGLAVFRVPAGRQAVTYHFEVVSATGAAQPGRPTVELVVRPGRPAVADLRPARFELGGAQEGPFVVQAHSASGRPLPGRAVVFRVRNAQIARDSVVTDSTGRARVEVTLGSQAGLALVTASLDSVQAAETLHVDPGPAVELILER